MAALTVVRVLDDDRVPTPIDVARELATRRYCGTPQEVVAAMRTISLRPAETRVLMHVWLRVYSRADDHGRPQAITFEEFCAGTGLSRTAVVKAVRVLKERGIVGIQTAKGKVATRYFVQLPTEWTEAAPTGHNGVSGYPRQTEHNGVSGYERQPVTTGCLVQPDTTGCPPYKEETISLSNQSSPNGEEEGDEVAPLVPKTPRVSEAERKVLDAWAASLPEGSRRDPFTIERVQAVRRALKRGETVAKCVLAVQGWRWDDWDRRAKNNDVADCLAPSRQGKPANIDRFAEWEQGENRPRTSLVATAAGSNGRPATKSDQGIANAQSAFARAAALKAAARGETS